MSDTTGADDILLAEAVSQPAAQIAQATIQDGPINMRFMVKTTPSGLLAIAALVTGTLLSSAAIVWTAGGVRRGHLLK